MAKRASLGISDDTVEKLPLGNLGEESDSDAAPEEESNASTRKSIKGLEKSRKPIKR
jgi:hypothetical protein